MQVFNLSPDIIGHFVETVVLAFLSYSNIKIKLAVSEAKEELTKQISETKEELTKEQNSLRQDMDDKHSENTRNIATHAARDEEINKAIDKSLDKIERKLGI